MVEHDFNLPSTVGFAGIDDKVSFESLESLSVMYYIAWGVLIHPEKFGTPRYPSKGFLIQLNDHIFARTQRIAAGDHTTSHIDFNAHLCGEYVDALLEEGSTGIEFLLKRFTNIQINLAGRPLTDEGRENLLAWRDHYGKQLILQVDDFPDNDDFSYINDRSQGRGINPAFWSDHRYNDSEGYRRERDREIWYAGGLNAGNILESTKAMSRFGPFYNVDMESGVRDDRNEFSLAKCKEVCEVLWGPKYVVMGEDGEPIVVDQNPYSD